MKKSFHLCSLIKHIHIQHLW